MLYRYSFHRNTSIDSPFGKDYPLTKNARHYINIGNRGFWIKGFKPSLQRTVIRVGRRGLFYRPVRKIVYSKQRFSNYLVRSVRKAISLL